MHRSRRRGRTSSTGAPTWSCHPPPRSCRRPRHRPDRGGRRAAARAWSTCPATGSAVAPSHRPPARARSPGRRRTRRRRSCHRAAASAAAGRRTHPTSVVMATTSVPSADTCTRVRWSPLEWLAMMRSPSSAPPNAPPSYSMIPLADSLLPNSASGGDRFGSGSTPWKLPSLNAHSPRDGLGCPYPCPPPSAAAGRAGAPGSRRGRSRRRCRRPVAGRCRRRREGAGRAESVVGLVQLPVGVEHEVVQVAQPGDVQAVVGPHTIDVGWVTSNDTCAKEMSPGSGGGCGPGSVDSTAVIAKSSNR